MEHVVFYQSAQGTPAFRRMASIGDAVDFAEHLRNVEGVTDFSVYALSPVSLKLRAYYRVEVSEAASGEAAVPAGVGGSGIAASAIEAAEPVIPAQPLGTPAAPSMPEAPSMTETPSMTEAPAATAIADAPSTAQEAEAPEEPEEPAPLIAAADPSPFPEPASPDPDRYLIPAEVSAAEETPSPLPEPTELPRAMVSDAPPAEAMPFVAGPAASTLAQAEAAEAAQAAAAAAEDVQPTIDGPAAEASLVDPTVEEIVPVPAGRRSMGFFARS
ncbi:MAG TPA: hypothetical protein VHC43_18295 [Mycobacteriales bacterium]|nr:hypothetical protein [Mycobacteriales bacterium]HVW80687.1 hypothetical protein [Mycobacteriales bacterium]